MKAKNRKKRIFRNPNRASWGIEATTTSWDWGFKPVPKKGGKTNNSVIQEKGGAANA